MKNKSNSNKEPLIKESKITIDNKYPDTDANKTGTDASADCTEKRKGANKFDKPKREPNPDSTRIDINPVKIKKHKTL